MWSSTHGCSLPLYDRLQYLVLPVLTLSLIPMGVIGRLVRATVLEIRRHGVRRRADRQGPDPLAGDPPHRKNAAPPVLA